MESATQTPQVAEIKHSECVAKASVETFDRLLGVQIEATDDAVESDATEIILGVLSLVGGVEWTVFVGLPKDTAIETAKAFAGFEIEFDSEDMGDAMGELGNIFAGIVQAKLDEAGVTANISLPSILRGKNMLVFSKAVKFSYNTPFGQLWTGVADKKAAPSVRERVK